MRRLMLLRHAKTETDAPSGRDRDRRLDDRGHRDAAEIGAWLGRHPPFPDFVQVSPAVRAKQTWELAWEAMKEHASSPQVEFLPELYGADPAQILQIIRTASVIDPKHLMVVGHNPGMHELALMLDRQRRCCRAPSARRQPADLGTCGVRLSRPTTGTTWRSAAASWCSLSAQNF